MATINTDVAELYEKRPEGYGPLRVEKVGPRAWRLVSVFNTPWGSVPAGFTFNGASVPRALWSFMDPAGEAFEAACVHDWYYQTSLKTKAFADEAFREILLDFGVPKARALVAYRMVRRFGKGTY